MAVSIVIPTFRRPDYLDRLLKSISLQTYQDFEIIIVDDNSPNWNKYREVIDRYKAIFTNFHVIHKKTNKGAPDSRNIGIRNAKHALIALVDDDDEWMPEKLALQVSFMNQEPVSTGLLFTGARVHFDDKDEEKLWLPNSSVYSLNDLLKECFIPSPTVMVRAEAINNAGLFDTSFLSCQDWDMWLRISQAGYAIKAIDQPLAIYHKHSAPSIGTSKNSLQGYYKIYTKHGSYYRKRFPKKWVKQSIWCVCYKLKILGPVKRILSSILE